MSNMTRIVDLFLVLFIVAFIVGFEETLRHKINQSYFSTCPESVTTETSESLRYYAKYKHFMTAGRLVKCRDEYFISEFYSQKGSPRRFTTDYFVNSWSFQQLQRQGDTCVVLVSVSKKRETALSTSPVDLRNTIHLWTNMEVFDVLEWKCKEVSQQKGQLAITQTVEKFLLMNEEEERNSTTNETLCRWLK